MSIALSHNCSNNTAQWVLSSQSFPEMKVVDFPYHTQSITSWMYDYTHNPFDDSRDITVDEFADLLYSDATNCQLQFVSKFPKERLHVFLAEVCDMYDFDYEVMTGARVSITSRQTGIGAYVTLEFLISHGYLCQFFNTGDWGW